MFLFELNKTKTFIIIFMIIRNTMAKYAALFLICLLA